jgi:hypothetical protein
MRTTLEAISLEKRRGIVDGYNRDDEIYGTVERLGTGNNGDRRGVGEKENHPSLNKS